MRNKNCILCKYRKDERACLDAIKSDAYHCPTLSNLWYGKLIYHFPFNLIFKIQVVIWGWRTDKEFAEKGGTLC